MGRASPSGERSDFDVALHVSDTSHRAHPLRGVGSPLVQGKAVHTHTHARTHTHTDTRPHTLHEVPSVAEMKEARYKDSRSSAFTEL